MKLQYVGFVPGIVALVTFAILTYRHREDIVTNSESARLFIIPWFFICLSIIMGGIWWGLS